MDNPNSKKDQLLSVKQRILQTGVKQQKLEDRLALITNELNKSKKNSQVFMIFFLVVIVFMGVLMYYLSENQPDKEVVAQVTEDLNPIQKANKVFREDLEKFRSEIVEYEERLQSDDHFLPSEKLIIKPIKKPKKSKYIKRHALVTNVYIKNGVVFMEADFVDYSEGKRAIEEAIKHGEAEYDISEEGDTLYFLYDGYYVNNWNPLHRILEIDNEVIVPGIKQTSEKFPVKAFKNVIQKSPLYILEIDNGIVYSITKQKLP